MTPSAKIEMLSENNLLIFPVRRTDIDDGSLVNCCDCTTWCNSNPGSWPSPA